MAATTGVRWYIDDTILCSGVAVILARGGVLGWVMTMAMRAGSVDNRLTVMRVMGTLGGIVSGHDRKVARLLNARGLWGLANTVNSVIISFRYEGCASHTNIYLEWL
jgi:hypothetical protein